MKKDAIFLDLVNNKPVGADLTIRYFQEDEDHQDQAPLQYYWHPSKNNILTIEIWGDKVSYAGILDGIDCYGECIPEDLIPNIIVDWINRQET